MEELVVVVIALGAVAAAPSVRVLRPAVKAVIKTSMAATEATREVCTMTADRVRGLDARRRARSEPSGAALAIPEWLDNNDLLQIDGVGPKVSAHLKNGGVETIMELAQTPVERLQAILDAAGPNFGAIDCSDWPKQAEALIAGDSL